MKPEQERVKNLLTDTVTLLCKNGLNFNKELKVQGLLGITLDGSDVFIVHINEKCGGEIVAVRADDGDEDLAALGLTYPRDTASPNLSRVKNRKSASTTSKHHGSDSPSAQTHSPKERVRLKRSNNTAEGSSQEPIQIKAEPDDDMFSSSCEKQGELDSRLAPDQPIGDSSGFGADFSQSLKHDPGDQDSNHGDSQENDTGPPTAKRKPPSSLSSARGSTSSDTTTTPFITGIIRNSVTDKTEPISGNAGSGEMGPLNQDSQVVVDSAPSWDASSESQGSQGISQTAESTAQDTIRPHRVSSSSTHTIGYQHHADDPAITVDSGDSFECWSADARGQLSTNPQSLSWHLPDSDVNPVTLGPDARLYREVIGPALAPTDNNASNSTDDAFRYSHYMCLDASNSRRRRRDLAKPFVCSYPGCDRSFFAKRHMLRHQTDKHGRPKTRGRFTDPYGNL